MCSNTVGVRVAVSWPAIHSKTLRVAVVQAKFLPHTGDCHIVTCGRDGQVRLAQLSTTGTCKATKRLATHKMAAHKVFFMCSAVINTELKIQSKMQYNRKKLMYINVVALFNVLVKILLVKTFLAVLLLRL